MPVPLDVFWDVQSLAFPASGTFDVLAELGGNTPVGAIFLCTHSPALNNGSPALGSSLSIGFTDGTNHVCVTNSYEERGNQASDVKNSGYSDEVAALFDPAGSGGNDDVNINWDSWRTTAQTGTSQTGVRLNVGLNTAGWTTRPITVMLFAGTDVDFAVGVTALSTTDTWVDETSPGFEPDIVLALVNDAFGSTARNGYFYSFGIVHNEGGGSVNAHYGGWFTQDQDDPNIGNKEADTTADHCGLHFTGSFTDQDEVECGQFDSSGMSFRARGADATDDVGWCAIALGGLEIELRTAALTEGSGTIHRETGFGSGFTPGWMLLNMGVGPWTTPGDSDLQTGVGLHARNCVTGVMGHGFAVGDGTLNLTSTTASISHIDGLAESVSGIRDFSFAGYESLVGGQDHNGELTHLKFFDGIMEWFSWGGLPKGDHDLILAVQDPRQDIQPLLADKMLELQQNPSFRM